MFVKYDIEKIKTFMTAFHNMTGLSISFWDNNINQLSYVPCEMNAFCSLVKSNPIGKKRCLNCDKKLILECKQKLLPVSAKCHAGLLDTAVPVVHNNQALGFFVFGQIKEFVHIDSDEEKMLCKINKELGFSYSEFLHAYAEIDYRELHVIQATANILFAATLNLVVCKAIGVEDNKLISEIHEYLEVNLHNTLSIPILCETFQISKNQLYSMWKKHYNITVGDYILQLRMEKAVSLLTNSEDKVCQICEKVGIPDYNYFSKLFKEYYGISPREYKKKFPFVLEKER